ncbi:TGF-beta receptor type-1 [Harpegnathos saltator]|uniref:TGF-beta receptor type-1 n=1 Tax=Harpegnathos saltator TaxID=610380 RepID=E2CA15_HARSA|nr:TGF-beta receptor type-1 [Harpegnathos saltator]
MRDVRDGGGMASLLALALFCFFHASCPVDGLLKCYCDICADTNYTCETDGYCFASTSLENEVVTHARRCVHKQLSSSQPEPFILCMTSDSRNMTFVIECCNQDYCNRYLKPQLHPRNKEGTIQTDLEVTKTLQVARAFAATLLFLLSSLPLFFSLFSLFFFYVSLFLSLVLFL